MAFQKRRVEKSPQKKYKKRNYKKTSNRKKSQKKSGFFMRIGIWILLGFLGVLCLGLFILYQKIIAPLPSVSELENLNIAEASIIYDRDGNELYKIFEENRIYKNYGDISKNIINALVAGEDKRYWENPGVDFIGLVRAGIYGIIGKNEGFGGTSTLTQQLIRNTIIENRSSRETTFDKIERKIKEIYLAFKLTNDVSKEKILELYLNKIDYGSNSYGIEQASQTFFGKAARDINILEASMLASLPKGPSFYSPYNNYDRLVGYMYLYRNDDSENITQIISQNDAEQNARAIEVFKEYIANLKLERYSDSRALVCGMQRENMKSNISMDSDGCSVMDYSEFLVFLNSIKIPFGDNLSIEYQTGRKDFILGRMLEDGYIDFEEYKAALNESIAFDFEKYREDIIYPHFVFYIREYLEEKYGKELLEKGGLRIYTSIDPELQDKAEEIVKAQAEKNEENFAAQNAALISLDNETGEILAMVGGRNYFDTENKGQVNVITSDLQPGSTFKPFVYSIAIDKEIIGSKTPVYDVETRFPGGYTPGNFDGEFMGKMDISTALNYSRNIPAVKMYFLAGGEPAVIDWMKKLGVNSIEDFKAEYLETYGTEYNYGAAMSLGTALMTPLELASAFSVYANMGFRKELVPVIKIYDSKGLVIEEFNTEQNPGEEVIDPSTAFITNHIMADTSTRPEFWNNYLSLRGRKVAAKTGTSTKQYISGGREIIAPRNLWTVGYTPQITTVVWAGNNDGSATNFRGNGLEGAGPIWKEFMEFAHQEKPALEWKTPSGVKKVNISDISGQLAPDGFNPNFIVSSLFVNAPQKYDSSSQARRVDLLCNGAIDDSTPISAIGEVNLIRFQSLKPTDPAWENPVQAWIAEGKYDAKYQSGRGFITQVSENICPRTRFASDIEIGTNLEENAILVSGQNYIQIGYQSSTSIQKIEVYLDETKIQEIPTGGKSSGVYSGNISLPKDVTGRKNLVFRAIDDEYFSQGISYPVILAGKDRIAPEITISNPVDKSISLFQEDFFNLRGTVQDASAIRSINIYVNDEAIKIGLSGREFVQRIDGSSLPVGKNTIRVEAVDSEFNIGETEILLTILAS